MTDIACSVCGSTKVESMKSKHLALNMPLCFTCYHRKDSNVRYHLKHPNGKYKDKTNWKDTCSLCGAKDVVVHKSDKLGIEKELCKQCYGHKYSKKIYDEYYGKTRLIRSRSGFVSFTLPEKYEPYREEVTRLMLLEGLSKKAKRNNLMVAAVLYLLTKVMDLRTAQYQIRKDFEFKGQRKRPMRVINEHRREIERLDKAQKC
jgi:hypothetical protein